MAWEAEVRGERRCDAAGFENGRRGQGGDCARSLGPGKGKGAVLHWRHREEPAREHLPFLTHATLISGAVRIICGNPWQKQEGISTDVSWQFGERQLTFHQDALARAHLTCTSVITVHSAALNSCPRARPSQRACASENLPLQNLSLSLWGVNLLPDSYQAATPKCLSQRAGSHPFEM